MGPEDIFKFSIVLPKNIPYQINFRHVTSIHMKWRDITQIVMVLKGNIEIDIRGSISRLSAGDILIINRGQVYEMTSKNNCLLLLVELDLYKFDLSQEDAENMWFRCNSYLYGESESYNKLKSLIAVIVNQNSSVNSSTLYDNKSYAYSLLNLLTQEFLDSDGDYAHENNQDFSHIRKALSYIDTHYQENLKLSHVASAMFLSTPYLSALFTRCLGATFTDYYNSIRLEHVVNLLLSTDEKVETIATKSGYSNAQALGRAFKDKYGILPSVYRKRRHHTVERTTYPNLIYTDTSNETPLDLSVLTQYLPAQNMQSPNQTAQNITKAVSSWSKVSGIFPDTYKRLIGIGSAKEILYAEVQEQLKEIQREIGFKYIKFHGLLSDEMMVVTRDISGDLVFNFRTIDMVFDFLFSIGLKPLIQLSFMPLELAKDRSKLIFTHRFNISEPSDMNEWAQLIESLFLHLIERYELAVVRELPVLLWNNADTSTDMFGMQNDLAFFELYKVTYETIKSICKDIQFGGPAITCMNFESINWTKRFFKWELERGIIPDFFCAQIYGVTKTPENLKIDLYSGQPDHIKSTQMGELPLMAGIPLTSDPNYVHNHRMFLDEFREELGLTGIPLWITEWNMTVSHNMMLNDTQFAGCYVIKNVLENSMGLESLGYWSATDFIEEQKLPDDIFHGGLGLMTTDGIRKPQFLAFQTLSQLCPNILTQGDGYFISRSEDCLTILLYNYEHYSDMFASNKTYNVNRTTRYTPFVKNESRKFHIHLTGIPNMVLLEAVEFIVNRKNGSAFDYWLSMGAPTSGKLISLDQYRLSHLKQHAHPLIHSITPKLKNGVLDYDAELESLEFRLVKLQFRNDEQRNN